MTITKENCSVYPIKVPANHGLKTFNFYLRKEAGSLSLIDAGVDTEECWDAFMSIMTENGFALQDLDRIILTHNHEDHIGLVNRISSVKEIPVYAHAKSIHRLKRDKEFFALRIEFFRKLYQEMGCGASGEQQIEKLKAAVKRNEKDKIKADIISLAESDTIAGLQAIETPGHSPDHLVFLDTERKQLFGGDHLIGHISSNAIVEPDQEGNRILTLVEYIRSLEKCSGLNIETIYSGHGNFIHNHRELIHHRLEKIHQKSERLLGLIDSGMSTAAQLAQSYYKDKYETQFSLVMSEIIGQLDWLETKKKIGKERKDGVWHYYVNPFE
ncbi:glyoxylase-like metal-dependent hydrolase (beta-lactamase superfamily II) [Bacillus fengqiuensis]|nr:glyoxylase-like metal-dependent hydrolase (beta-lactamase superfamily II) [Bacillus fengqiuensis]